MVLTLLDDGDSDIGDEAADEPEPTKLLFEVDSPTEDPDTAVNKIICYNVIMAIR